MLRFPYLEEPLQGPAPPSLPAASTGRWRPLVPVTVYGPAGRVLSFGRALVDSGADDTILPLDTAAFLGVAFLTSTGYAMRWRGQRYPLRFGEVELELVDDNGKALRWRAIVAFTAAPMRYPLLGMAGCLEFLDARFLGKSLLLELEPNTSRVTVVPP